MSTYQAVLKRAERVIKNGWAKEHIRDFVEVIPSLPAVSAVLTPHALEVAVRQIEQAQTSGDRRSVIAAPWGAYPLVVKIALQKQSAAILEDTLPRVEQAARRAGRKRDFRNALKHLADPDPKTWMPALVEITVIGAVDRNGYRYRPYQPAGTKNHDLVILTPLRQVHLDCLCITRSMIDWDLRAAARGGVSLSVDPEVDLVLGKIRDKAPQLRAAGDVPKGVIIAFSGFGPDLYTTRMGVLKAIDAGEEYRTFSVFGVTNGTAATGVMWFPNPRAEVQLADEEWAELTKVFPGVPVQDNGCFCAPLTKDVDSALKILDDLGFRFLQSVL